MKDQPYIPHWELRFTFARGSGPGGQNVNKVNSKAIMKWGVLESSALPPDVKDRFLKRYGGSINAEGDLVLASDRFRDQKRNTSDCEDKLMAMIARVWTKPKPRVATRPTRGSVKRRLEGKKIQSLKKQSRRVRE